MRAKLFIALGALVAMWAVPSAGTAPFTAKHEPLEPVSAPMRPARLRVERKRGLLLSTWINGHGPYLFAVDTGAGMNLVTQRVAAEAQLAIRSVRPTMLGGLSGVTTTSSREAVINQLALGDASNIVPSTKAALVISVMPNGVDGILDPTDIYAPFGYSIDMPNRRIEAVDNSVRTPASRFAGEGAIVPWLRMGDNTRPFVRLGDGRLALVDTGSGFGLAVNERDALIIGPRRSTRAGEGTHDIGGGTVTSRRVAPTTISIGELVLQRVPTDILFGIHDSAPVILGRDLLYPFKLTFDPQRRLIEFTPSERS
jgi:hypothetical protein